MNGIQLSGTLVVSLTVPFCALVQDPTGVMEGHVVDMSSRPIGGARVQARKLDTQSSQEVLTAPSGLFRLPVLPVGQYSLTVDAVHFARYEQEPIQIT